MFIKIYIYIYVNLLYVCMKVWLLEASKKVGLHP